MTHREAEARLFDLLDQICMDSLEGTASEQLPERGEISALFHEFRSGLVALVERLAVLERERDEARSLWDDLKDTEDFRLMRAENALREILGETNFPQDEPQSRWVRAVSRIQNVARVALETRVAVEAE